MRNLFIIMSISLFCFFVLDDVKADSDSFGKTYFNGGYKEINMALQESKDHFERNIALPTQLPPIPFTHSMGRFSDSEGLENDKLEIMFINKDLPQNHYAIVIQPIEYALRIKEEKIDQEFKLEDGNQSIYTTTVFLGFNLLVFEKDGLQYILSIDKRNSDKVTKEVLINIANSIK